MCSVFRAVGFWVERLNAKIDLKSSEMAGNESNIDKRSNNFDNHKNYNFLACNWLKNVLFSTNSLAKLLSDSLLLDSLLLDSLLLDSLISQSHSKMQCKSTNHIQSCNYVCGRARCCFCAFGLYLRDVYASFVSILMRTFPFFHNFAIFLFLGNCNFYDLIDNRTSCRLIQSVIILVINKSDSRCAVVRFCYHSYD